jgi:hypothetical protein
MGEETVETETVALCIDHFQPPMDRPVEFEEPPRIVYP